MSDSRKIFLRSFYVVVLVLLASCAATGSLQQNDIVLKSPSDKRDYRQLVLPNGLEALLVSDMDAEKAAAAMDVSVGSGDDDEDRAGIAHFLEHMLFLGTAKYPSSGEYQSFIRAHGGQHNAYTSFEHTNYFFDIDPAYLGEALERFSQFFIAPLFTEEYVEREKHAVDSEYRAKIRSDARRSLDVFKQLSHPQHRYSNFSVGSLETLQGDDLRDDVIAFYNKHYSADRMKLVIVAPLALDDMQDAVLRLFSEVPQFETQRQLSQVPLVPKENLGKIVYMEPVANKKELTLSFEVPNLRPWHNQRPVHYISHVLGHEGQGSLLQYLKQQGLATALASGPGLDALDAASMVVQIELTDLGYQQIDKVIELAFAAIEFTGQQAVKQEIYQEVATVSELNFRFQQKQSPVATASQLANFLQRFSAEDVLYAPYKMNDFSEQLIRDYLAYLKPENSLIAITAKNIQADSVTPWFNTPYRVTSISEKQMQAWQSPKIPEQFSAPAPNRLLPEDLQLRVTQAAEKPVLQQGLPYELWFASDGQFALPKANIRLNLRNQAAMQSARTAALLQLYVAVIREQTNELSYDAYLANMSFSIAAHARGLSIDLSGYSDKQDVLLTEIAKALSKPDIGEQQFNALKLKQMRYWQDRINQKPYAYLLAKASDYLLQPQWSAEQLNLAAADIQLADIQAFSEKFRTQLSMEALVHGNYQPQQAEQLLAGFNRQLQAVFVAERPTVKVRKFVNGERYQQQYAPQHDDSSVVFYWQAPDKNYRSRAAFALTTQILGSAFFDLLRTEKQLGYIVFASNMPMLDAAGAVFVVQSPNTSAAQLSTEIDQFLQSRWVELSEMPIDLYRRHQAALLAQLDREPQTLTERTDDFWSDIGMRHLDFDDRQQLFQAVRDLEFQEWLIYTAQAWEQGGHLLFWAAGNKSPSIPQGFEPLPEQTLFYEMQ